jgi:hypothetical protein
MLRGFTQARPNWMMQSAKLDVPKHDEDQAILSYEQFVAIALKESH